MTVCKVDSSCGSIKINENKENNTIKKTAIWNGRTVIPMVAGGVVLLALSIYLYRNGTFYKSAQDNTKFPIREGDYECLQDAGELYRYGASDFKTSIFKDTPACMQSVLAPFCKQAVEKMCEDKGDTCSDIQIESVLPEHGFDFLCYAKAISKDCKNTFKPINSSMWSWLVVRDFKGWENNPIVRWAQNMQNNVYDPGSITFKTHIECPKETV